MTTKQLKQATQLALSNAELTDDISVFDGCGLPGFVPVFVTSRQLARFIRWQAVYFNGELDNAELANIATIGKRLFRVIDVDKRNYMLGTMGDLPCKAG